MHRFFRHRLPLVRREIRRNGVGGVEGPRAFTLVEALAAIAVLGVIGSIASLMIMAALDGYTKMTTQAQLHTELSIAMDRIDQELRKIPLKTSYGSIAPNISNVTASSISWNSNYSLTLTSGRVMFVEAGSASSILIDNVTGFVVTCYNESNAALAATLTTTACDPIRRVLVQITVQRSGVTEVLRAKVFLRCTMEDAA